MQADHHTGAHVDMEGFFTLSIDMLCIAGFDGYFKRVSPAWERTLGWTNEELTTRPWVDFVHPDDVEPTIAAANRQIEEGRDVVSFENRYRAKDGSYHWLLWNSRPSPDTGLMHAIARDITEQKQADEDLRRLNATLEQQVQERSAAAEERALQAEHAEQELRLAEQRARSGAERMRYFLGHLPLGMALLDEQLRYSFVTQRFCEDFRLGPEEHIGLLHTDLLPGTEDIWREAYARCRDGGTQQSEEREFVLRDGRREWLLWRADPWRVATGEIQGMILYVEFITARKEAERRVLEASADLARSNSELEAFTYSVSHDLKEPLRTIEAFSQFLIEDYGAILDDQGRDYLVKLGAASARMKRLIEDLLALSRIGRAKDDESTIDLGRIVAGVVESLRSVIEHRGAGVTVEPDLPAVRGNATRLEQILGNLISNGIKFNRSEQPIVEVGVHEVLGEMVTLYVRDNGIGIEPQYQDRVFGIFQRLHRREEFEGTGAGLAIAKRAAEALGGQLRVESDGSTGSTFLVTLRLAQPVNGQARAA